MVKYFSCVFLAGTLMAGVQFEEGKPQIQVPTGIFPLDLTELTTQSTERMFSKKIDEQVLSYQTSTTPRFVDLRSHMSRVKRQSVRASCSAFSAMGLIEHRLNRFADYSEQCLVYKSGSTDEGDLHQRVSYARNHGFFLERDCPYVDPAKYSEWKNATAEQKIALQERAAREIPDLKGKSPLFAHALVIDRHVDDFSAGDNLAYVRQKILAGHPVGASVFVVGDEWGNGSILKIPSDDDISKSCRALSANASKKSCSNHAIIITGFNDSLGVLTFKNSWGESWGVNRKYLPPASHENPIGYGVVSYQYFSKFSNGKLITLE